MEDLSLEALQAALVSVQEKRVTVSMLLLERKRQVLASLASSSTILRTFALTACSMLGNARSFV